MNDADDVSVRSINNLQKLRAQLFCQQNVGSNNNRGGAVVDSIVTALSINNHGQRFTTTSRHNNLTFVVCKHTIKDAILMRAKSDGQCCSVDVDNIKHRDTPWERLCATCSTVLVFLYLFFLIETLGPFCTRSSS